MKQIIRELKRQAAGEKLEPEQLKGLIRAGYVYRNGDEHLLTDMGHDALAQPGVYPGGQSSEATWKSLGAFRAALNAGTPWLDVYCPSCGTGRPLDLRKLNRHPLASVGTLVLGRQVFWLESEIAAWIANRPVRGRAAPTLIRAADPEATLQNLLKIGGAA